MTWAWHSLHTVMCIHNKTIQYNTLWFTLYPPRWSRFSRAPFGSPFWPPTSVSKTGEITTGLESVARSGPAGRSSRNCAERRTFHFQRIPLPFLFLLIRRPEDADRSCRGVCCSGCSGVKWEMRQKTPVLSHFLLQTGKNKYNVPLVVCDDIPVIVQQSWQIKCHIL